MLAEIIALFLAASMLLYCLFAGADFGAGILTAFLSRDKLREQRAVISRAIAPVWEANHVWLILAVVILFVGFPRAYSALSITFHIPLTLMLVGIILRGSAFTYEHYDIGAGHSKKIFTRIFIASSFLAPFMMGTIAGGMILKTAAYPLESFAHSFLAPWLNLFSFSLGAFTCVLFAYLAAVYLIGETDDAELREIFIRRAKQLNASAVICGSMIFISAEFQGLNLIHLFISEKLSLCAMGFSTLLIAIFWIGIRRHFYQSIRAIAAAQVALVLVGWFSLQFPILIHSTPEEISIYNSSAPDPILRSLLYSLVAGLILVLPALAYLLKTFKSRRV